jgi:hypothetical protein
VKASKQKFGNCITVFTGGHLSYPDHNSKFPLFFNKFFYAVGNGAQSLHNTGMTHRWSDGNDKDGQALCVSKADAGCLEVCQNLKEMAARFSSWTKAQSELIAKDAAFAKELLVLTCNLAGLSAKTASWAKAQAESRASDEQAAKDALATTCNHAGNAAKTAAWAKAQAESRANDQQVTKDVLSLLCNLAGVTVKSAAWAKTQAESRASVEQVESR